MYSAVSAHFCSTRKALRHGSHSVTCDYINACLYLVTVHAVNDGFAVCQASSTRSSGHLRHHEQTGFKRRISLFRREWLIFALVRRINFIHITDADSELVSALWLSQN